MTLNLYIARRFAALVALVFAIFFGIMMLIDTIDQLRRFSGGEVSLGRAVELAAMNVPASLYRILPLILIMAAISLFLGLARTSELVVVRASGRSGLRFLVAPVVTALLLGAGAVAVLNPLVAATTKQYDTLWSRYARESGSVLSIADTGLWLRQGGAEGQTVVQAARANRDGTELYGVTFLTFDETGLPFQRIEAERAQLEPGAWVLAGARQWSLRDANPERTATSPPDGTRLPSDLTEERIRDSFGSPSAIPIWQLPSYITSLETAGFTARGHRVWFQMELALPLLLASMVLVAAGFTMRHARFGGTGTMVMLALAGGFALFFLRNFAQVLGETGQIPILLAAWAPPLAALLTALGLLLHLEEG